MKINSIVSVFISIAALVLCGVAFTTLKGSDVMFIVMDIILMCAIMGFSITIMLIKNEKYRIYSTIPILIISMCIFIPSISGWRIAVFVVFLICYVIMLVYLFISKSLGSSIYIIIMQLFLLIYSILEIVAASEKYYILYYVACIVCVASICAYIFDYAYGSIHDYFVKKSPKDLTKKKSLKRE